MPEDGGFEAPDLTLFLRQLASGDEASSGALMPHVYSELRAIAAGCLRGQAASNTLQPTALVNEAFLKLFDRDRLRVEDRLHFFRLAARVMRQLLVDHARERRSLKRGGARAEATLDEAVAAAAGFDVDVLDLDAALSELAERDPRQGQVVELRYFAGLEVAEVAAILAVSKTTVEEDWRCARAWLGARLGGARPD